MIESFLPHSLLPAFILVLGGLLIPLLPQTLRRWYMLALPIVGCLHFLSYDLGNYGEFQFFGETLTLMRLDPLSRIFALIFFIATALNVIYAWYVDNRLQQTVSVVYPGTAMAGVFAGDLISLFVFWELAAVTSVFLVWAGGTQRAYKAGMRYLIIQVGSGVLLLAGLILLYQSTGSIVFDAMELGTLPTLLIFLAFGVKAAFPLLHNWVQDSYPESTVTGTIVLSIFTTKLAVYSLARGFPGQEELIYIGAAMTFFPIFFAMIEDNLRRVLTYSINNQVGFMVCAIGIGGSLGINGAAGYAFCNIIFEGLLFMSICAVMHRTGTAQASELGGMYKSMPLTACFCIIGALSISAFPLFAGFVSKGMILDGVAQHHLVIVWLVLLFASAGVLEHAGIKIPYFGFFAHDSGKRVKEAPLSMLIAMGISAVMCIAIGVYPELLYMWLPLPVDYVPYTAAHVVTQLQLLFFAILAFVVLVKIRYYPPEIKSTNLDFDWFYRRLAPMIVMSIVRFVQWFNRGAKGVVHGRIQAVVLNLYRHHGPEGGLARSWPSGDMAMWIAILLSIVLGLNFL